METGLSQVRKKFLRGQGKGRELYFESGKIDIFWKKLKGSWNHHTTDERLEEAFQVICDWSQRCHYLIKRSFEQVENVSVLRIKWVKKQPGGCYCIWLMSFWSSFGLTGKWYFFIREFEKWCRSVTAMFKGWHTLGDMLLGNEVGTCCRNSLNDLPPVFRKRFGFAFAISSSHYFFTKMISFFKQDWNWVGHNIVRVIYNGSRTKWNPIRSAIMHWTL